MSKEKDLPEAKKPNYRYSANGIGVLSYKSAVAINGGPDGHTVGKCPWSYFGEPVVSKRPLTDEEVRDQLPLPYGGFMRGDFSQIEITYIGAFMPGMPGQVIEKD